MKVQKFIFSPFQENTYIVWDEDTKDAIIIDPGCLSKTEEAELENFISQNNLEVKYLFNTHGHLDHIFGNAFIKSRFNPIHYASEKDMPLFERAEEQAESFGLTMKKSPNPDFYFNESEILKIIGTEIKLIFTPGHTPGEFCIYFPNENTCFTGDVLFNESIGRTDLWGGNYETLMHSIISKLLILPDETTIYPGHGEKSTIQNEKMNNPFLN
ncbi:MAG: MBL fold metallo-hydrolase [Bacteroidetes bacterium]|nr:MBL fold metallo-hydrolase [Bacteroidota bacterium]MBU1116129.1 MBL fold metallo-hydrolase [Bacteroidota bacterium]MBU1800421.1 MBL fold metallo-hydrolase [Bacteroidota bacterium]